MVDTLMIKMLVVAGFTPDEAQQMREELNKKVNAAIIDAVMSALTLDERQALKAVLMQGPKTLEAVTSRLIGACDSSVNKPNSYSIFTQTKAGMLDEFWKNIDSRLTDDQRDQISGLIEQELKAKPELQKAIAEYQKIFAGTGA